MEPETTKVEDCMGKDVTTADLKVTISDASRAMRAYNVGYIIVLDNMKPVGIVTERDIVHRAIAKGLNPSTTTVDAIMSSPIVPVDPDASVEAAVEIMVKRKLRRLPVVKDSSIYGILTTQDLIDHFGELEDRLTDVIIKGFFVPTSG